MEKIVLLILLSLFLCADELVQCDECHNTFQAPPYKKIYKHYLLKYSSKIRVENAMIDFLKEPSEEKSAMPRGMKKRFNPSKHPVFDTKTIEKMVKYLVQKEDVIAKIKLVQD